MNTILRRPVCPERRARKYNAMVNANKVRSVVRQATDQSVGELMDPFELDVKSGLPVHKALAKKHPDLLVPRVEDDGYVGFEDYPAVPGMVPMTVSDDGMAKVARCLKGGGRFMRSQILPVQRHAPTIRTRIHSPQGGNGRLDRLDC